MSLEIQTAVHKHKCAVRQWGCFGETKVFAILYLWVQRRVGISNTLPLTVDLMNRSEQARSPSLWGLVVWACQACLRKLPCPFLQFVEISTHKQAEFKSLHHKLV